MKTDIDLIKSALGKPLPKPRKVRLTNKELRKSFFSYDMFKSKSKSNTPFVKEIGSNLEDPGKDPIYKLGKKLARKKKLSNDFHSYNSSDWFEYLRSSLKPFGVLLEKPTSTVIHREIAEIYDNLIEIEPTSIGNDLLKEYFDWWVSSNAHKHSCGQITLRYLNRLDKIKIFTSGRKNGKLNEPKNLDKPNKEISIHDIKKLGTHALLINYGIVKTFQILLETNPRKEVVAEIKKATDSLSKELIEKLLVKTKENQPYDGSVINFYDLIRASLNKFKIDVEAEELVVSNLFQKEKNVK